MPFQIIRNDITAVQADAIVNTANPKPVYADGTDRAIYEAAGAEQLLAARRQIGPIARGEVAVTPAFALQARYILHTVGPVWAGGTAGEFDILASCYRSCLQKAAELGCSSIAFPLIATGVYGFPKDRALEIATAEIRAFLRTSEMTVLLVVFDPKSFALSQRLSKTVQACMDDRAAIRQAILEYGTDGWPPYRHARLRRELQGRPGAPEAAPDACAAPGLAPEASAVPAPPEEVQSARMAAPPARSLEEAVAQIGESFQQRLLRLIDQSGQTDVTVYNRANLTRQHFSKIRSNAHYQPKKETVLALAIALELNMDETLDLLRRAGYTLSPASRYDLAVAYFIETGQYDIYEINIALFALTGRSLP